jgi:3-hydroxyisobutyrate dehydrogenase-like beta-hydroxyacid dehydrogenase
MRQFVPSTAEAQAMTSIRSQVGPIGFVGLGLLGTALCERLLGAGFRVLVYNRTQDKAEPLIARGAEWSDNPFVECQRVVVCLYTTDIVRQVLEDLAGGIRSGQIIIDTTTGDPTQTQELGVRLQNSGISYLESPIAASSEQTRQGEALAMIGGPRIAYDASRDLLQAMAAKSFYLGDWGAAARMKLVNNLVLGLNRVALAEGLAFAERVGLDVESALAVLMAGNAHSVVMDVKGRKMLDNDFSPQGRLSQHAKDIRLVLQEAEIAKLDLPMTRAHLEVLRKAEAAGWGEYDNSAVIRAIDNQPLLRL